MKKYAETTEKDVSKTWHLRWTTTDRERKVGVLPGGSFYLKVGVMKELRN